MAKILRKALAWRNTRRVDMEATRNRITNPKIDPVKAYKMPGSMKK